jgi:DNA-binding response OmpR family regulator
MVGNGLRVCHDFGQDGTPNPDLARTAMLRLQLYGMDVQTLSTGLPVLDTARSFRPHFILLDIGLPDLNGFQIAELIRRDPELNRITIIGVSAYNADMCSGQSRPEHFDHYLVKPVNFDSLVSLLTPGVNQAS